MNSSATLSEEKFMPNKNNNKSKEEDSSNRENYLYKYA